MAIRRSSAISRLAAIGFAVLALAACQESNIPKDIRPLPGALVAKMQQLGMSETSPVLIRIFKESSQLEVWKQRRDGQYALLKTYEICKWSGGLGPKKVEGDRQAPEGYYIVTPAQMNPKSSYYLSFNIGYPNAYDRAYGRTGSNLMVHGACSSAGCYSMTDEAAGELFALARDAFKGGQRQFQIEAYPFRMTAENMAKHRDDPNMDFWRMLKVGYDHFEVTRQVPKVDVCGKKYVFNADAGNARFVATAACPPYVVPPAIASAVAAKEAADEKTYAATVASLETSEEKAAAAEAAAQAKAAAKATAEAEKASKPSLWDRWFGKDKKEPTAAPPAPSAAAPAATAPTPATPISTAPLPRGKPAAKATVEANAAPAPPQPAPAAVAKPVLRPTKPAAVAADTPPPDSGDVVGSTTSAPEPLPGTPAVASTDPAAASKTVGKVVQKEFFWADDTPAN